MKKKSLLILGHNWPEPNSTAAGTRMLQLIDVFLRNNFVISFACVSIKNEHALHLESLCISTYNISLNDSSFDLLARKLNPDIVLFDRFLTEEQFGWRIVENCPRALRILDTEDLHFLRTARYEAHKSENELNINHLRNDITKREIASIYRCDLSLIISKFEYNLLVEEFKMDSSILLYIPFLIDSIDESKLNTYPDFNLRRNFVFMGNFKHKPNINAVQVLKKDIWPKISKELPKAELHIYGAYADNHIIQLQNIKDKFIFKGWAENKKNVLSQARVFLAPLQFGAGLKGKLIDSMLFGIPNVTTQVGAEAMHDNLPWNGFICDGIEEFIKKSVDLYTNESYWRASQGHGIAIINKLYSKQKFTKILIQEIVSLQSELDNHRLKNFIGSVLLHHTLQSTKYLSKWIEEKNTK